MQQESQEMLNFTSNFFSFPETDKYVDFFFTDNKQDPINLANFNNEQNLFEQKLFPAQSTCNNTAKSTTFCSNQQQKKLQTKKKMKNTYASKIAKLIHQDVQVQIQNGHQAIKIEDQVEHQQHLNYFDQKSRRSQSMDDSTNKKQQKLLKNRLSAQKSRKMKKQYMQILADRVEQLQQQLETERKINQKNAQKLKKYSHHEATLNGYFISSDQIIEKLEQAIKNKASQQQLSILLDSVKFRFGGSGKQRMNIVRYYYEQIFDLLVPDLSKYVIYSAMKNIGVFNTSRQKTTQLMKVLDVKGQKQMHIRSLKQSLLRSREAISEISGELISAKQKLDKQVRKLDDIFDQMRCVINVETQIRCILFLQKNKYKPQYNLAWKDWKKIFLEKLDSKQSNLQPRKLIKTM